FVFLVSSWWVFSNRIQILHRVFSRFFGRAGPSLEEAGSGEVAMPFPAAAWVGAAESAERAAVATSNVGKSAPPVENTSEPMNIILGEDEPPAVPETESRPTLSATERNQRLELTAIALEWIVIGSVVYWLAGVCAGWLVRRLGGGLWDSALTHGLEAISVIPVALYAGGFPKWRRICAMAAALIVVILGISLFTSPRTAQAQMAADAPAKDDSSRFEKEPVKAFERPETWEPRNFLARVASAIYLGAVSALLFRIRTRRAVLSVIAAPAAAMIAASPILIGCVVAGLYVVPRDWLAAESTSANPVWALSIAAFVWCTLVTLAATASETVLRHFVTDRPVIRGVLALALAFSLAAVAVFLAVSSTLILNETGMKLATLIVLFGCFQLVPPIMRWQWHPVLSAFAAGASLVTICLVELAEWLAPGSSLTLEWWVIAGSAIVVLNVKTVDIFTHKAEVWNHLRSRMRSRRLPVKVTLSRA
ncbi:MAG TPA: hypothetical protein VGY53_04450, partial [Isosphaeraceae bacterium]|nr:hypothetical protein [Isosphaeraceae bacterium]